MSIDLQIVSAGFFTLLFVLTLINHLFCQE